MNKQEFRTIRRRYRVDCREALRGWRELGEPGVLSFTPDEYPESYACLECLHQRLKEFAAAVGRPSLYPSRVLVDMLNLDKGAQYA